MQYDQLPFPEAVEDLAGRLGLTVPHEARHAGARRPRGRQLAPLYELLARVAEFYAASSAPQRARPRLCDPARSER